MGKAFQSSRLRSHCHLPQLLSQQVLQGKAAQSSQAEAQVGSLTSGHSFIHVCAQTPEFTTEKFPHQHQRSSSKKNGKDPRDPISCNTGFLLRSRREGTEKRENPAALPFPPLPQGPEGVDALGSQTLPSFLTWPRGQAASRTKSS